ncbi:FimV/HubP family polar landmark protein [Pseudomonas sessilinigenes]|uniref:FimV family protein n=1 Tax=Pseudomonas sessilinigenes TaxID=658629 RepID=A0ABX8MWU1_9PSED|nr:FimV/HubP family polar landmark protein [Pseudomonas sessilinigenes]AZC23793.1 putative type IV pilus assembly FimV-related transmembrane protein [Pseudomonas sessilinigenes]QXH42778.1 FimV family protein [Pseudomonas sessilinigenes]
MVQVRKLVLAIAAASALSSGMAQALGLGELTLKSSLNQPLVAEIELLDIKDLTAAEVVPSLAPAEEFAKAGVDRQAFLNDLSFTPILNPGGKSVLRVTSSQPLSEPMVKFLVQVMWPNGRLLRDYSVLLDPSKFSPQAAAAAQAPLAGASVNAPVTAANKVSKPEQYTTSARDTLWEIAAKNRNGASIQQTMLAIQALNPDAFIDGNINRLKTGRVLRLPDVVQSTALPQPKAIAEVAAQNAAWRQGRRAGTRGQQQVDATRRSGTDKLPKQVNTKDNLSLVSAESGKARGKGAAGDSKALNNKLAVTQESLDATRRDNAELKDRMADLQSQLDKLQRLIDLKNSQLAKLQAEGAAPAAPAAPVAPPMPAELVAKPEVPAAPVAPVAPVSEPAASPAVDAQAVKTDEDKYADLLSNPILLGLVGGGAVAALLLLLLLLARRRKAQQEAEKHLRMARALSEESDFAQEMDLPEGSFEGLEVPPPSVKLAPAPAPAPEPKPEPVVAPVPAAPLERATDVLGQAQNHIDGGRLNQAAAILEEAVKLEPQRSELRLKLMEVYARQGDRSAFVTQERQLVANGDNHAQVEQLKSRFPAMVAVAAAVGLATAAAAAELDAEYVKELLQDEPAAPEPAAPVEGLDADFDLSLDDLEAASPAALTPEPEPEPEPEADVELEDFPLDDDLSFGSVLEQQIAPAVPEESLDDLGDFDLDLGADLPAASQSDDEFLMSLEDDLKDLPADDVPTVTESALDDLDLSADFDLSLADEMDVAEPKDAFASELDDVNAELDRLAQSLDQPQMPTFTAEDAAAVPDEADFDFLSGSDEVATKLDLAQAYIDMGDNDGARDILGEVLSEGSEGQKSEAQEMLARLA